MTKRNFLITILSVVACMLIVFLTVLFLSLPIGGREGVIPPVVLTVVGSIFAGISLVAGVAFFVRFRQGG